MQTTATVIRIAGDRAIVTVERQAACDGCHKNKDGGTCSICSLTGAGRKFEATAINTIGAGVGDRVTVSTDSGRVLGYSVLVFLVPLVAGIAFYFLAGFLTNDDFWRCVALIIGFGFSFFGIWIYSRVVSKRRCDVEIVAIVDRRKSDTK